jgi:hypothetical protein
VATFSSIEPPVLGLQVRLVAGTNRLLVQNWSGKTVVILGSSGRPHLRFERRGVFWNTRGASSGAQPAWERLNPGKSFAFSDNRVGWTSNDPPEVVRRDPTHSHLIRYWRIPATADGKPIAIKGFLGYVPPSGVGNSGGLGAGALAAIVVAVIAAGVAALLIVRRRRARRPGGRRAPAVRSG